MASTGPIAVICLIESGRAAIDSAKGISGHHGFIALICGLAVSVKIAIINLTKD